MNKKYVLIKYYWILFFSILISFSACSSSSKDEPNPAKKYTRFNGNYNKGFNDMHDLHITAAIGNGVGPLTSRDDTAKYSRKLDKLPSELEIYKIDPLKHSVPFLVPKASKLLSEICINFRDSLISKNMPMYKPIVTSITRTDDDVEKLSKRNTNASFDSAHRYGTTFDISWSRFSKVNPADERTLDDGRLKLVLAQVLHDLKQRNRCYIKHEKRQACFHITVR